MGVDVKRQLSPFGVEIQLDLGTSPDELTREGLREALASEQLLVIREQSLSFDQQCDVLETFGAVLFDDPHQLGVTYVTNVGPAAAGGAEELTYHYDLAHCPEPFSVVSLHATEVEDDKTTTRFVNGVRACSLLDPSLQVYLADRMARHVYPGLGPRGITASRRDFDPELPHSLRPVISTHPGTGRPILSVSRFSTNAIIGMDVDESTEMLDRLYAHLYAEDNTYVHSWRQGDLVIWDNLSLQHARGDVPESRVGRRILQKVVVANHGQADQFPDYDRWRMAEDVALPT